MFSSGAKIPEEQFYHFCKYSCSGTSLKEGWLVKRGNKRKTWKRRFFVLNANVLFYCEAQRDPSTAVGLVFLERCSFAVYGDNGVDPDSPSGAIDSPVSSPGSYEGHAFVFTITTGDGRMYFMSAASAEERDSWLEALSASQVSTARACVARKDEELRRAEREAQASALRASKAEAQLVRLQEQLQLRDTAHEQALQAYERTFHVRVAALEEMNNVYRSTNDALRENNRALAARVRAGQVEADFFDRMELRSKQHTSVLGYLVKTFGSLQDHLGPGAVAGISGTTSDGGSGSAASPRAETETSPTSGDGEAAETRPHSLQLALSPAVELEAALEAEVEALRLTRVPSDISVGRSAANSEGQRKGDDSEHSAVETPTANLRGSLVGGDSDDDASSEDAAAPSREATGISLNLAHPTKPNRPLPPLPSTPKFVFDSSFYSGPGEVRTGIKSATIWTGSWNVQFIDPFAGITDPGEKAHLLREFVPAGYDIYVLGIQEGINEGVFDAVSVRLAGLGLQRVPLRSSSGSIVDRVSGRGDGAILNVKFTGIACYVRRELIANGSCQIVECAAVGEAMGSKGAVAFVMLLFGVTVCFVNCHLAAFDPVKRVKQFRTLVGKLGEALTCCKGVGLGVVGQFHQLVWMGDLNYRIAGLSCDEVLSMLVDHQSMRRCFAEHDSLRRDQAAGMAFHGFREPYMVDDFYPTYKKKKNRPKVTDFSNGNWLLDTYKTSRNLPFYSIGKSKPKDRVPGWCDRVLWLPNDEHSVLEPLAAEEYNAVVRQNDGPGKKKSVAHEYRAINDGPVMSASDHSPVFAGFRLLSRRGPLLPDPVADSPREVFMSMCIGHLEVVRPKNGDYDWLGEVEEVQLVFPAPYEDVSNLMHADTVTSTPSTLATPRAPSGAELVARKVRMSTTEPRSQLLRN